MFPDELACSILDHWQSLKLFSYDLDCMLVSQVAHVCAGRSLR